MSTESENGSSHVSPEKLPHLGSVAASAGFGGGSGMGGGSGTWPSSLGVLVSGLFYLIVYFVPWQPLQRYFLGHPVAIAATVLFWVAAAVLAAKWWQVTEQWNRLSRIRDEDLLPPQAADSPAGRWLGDHDAGYVARRWMQAVGSLPAAVRSSLLVGRLHELLTRQSQRGTTKHLADDLREIAGRDADTAHDSFGLVRIIVWAIPMLGFLGTVIGITQTLGGLDFTDGTAAVDRLKSGLYVAFDTTALGLVLSVLAIFMQFPVERSEQRLLGAIDSRIGHLLSAHLPSDDAADNQTAMIADLCGGIQAAVAESLSSQAELWRTTIDEAREHWQGVQASAANHFTEAVRETLAPALQAHAGALHAHGEILDAHAKAINSHADAFSSHAVTMDSHAEAIRSHAGHLDSHAGHLDSHAGHLDSHAHRLDSHAHRLDSHADRLDSHAGRLDSHAGRLDSHAGRLASHAEEFETAAQSASEQLSKQVGERLGGFQEMMVSALQDHAAALDESARFAGDRLDRQATHWQQTLDSSASAMLSHQQSLAEQCQTLVEQSQSLTRTNERTEAIQAIQQALDANVAHLHESNQAIRDTVAATSGDGIVGAMKILARAVETLSVRIPETTPGELGLDATGSLSNELHSRRAA